MLVLHFWCFYNYGHGITKYSNCKMLMLIYLQRNKSDQNHTIEYLSSKVMPSNILRKEIVQDYITSESLTWKKKSALDNA